jgi:hypothetical protein
MEPNYRLLLVQLVNSEVGVSESELSRGLLRYFRPYMQPVPNGSPSSERFYVDSPIVYAALAVRVLERWWPHPLCLTPPPQALVDVDGNVVPLQTVSLRIMDYHKLSRFCGFADHLSGLVQKRQTTDFFESTPPEVVALLSAWCEQLEPPFWKSEDAKHDWFNITFKDDFHKAAYDDLNNSSLEPWQYLHWYLRLWRNSVEHTKKQSVAQSFAHMLTLPPKLLAAVDQLETVSWKLS